MTEVLSPNRGARREAARPDLLVLHYTAMQSAGAAIERLCAPEAEVSAHYVICERGGVTRLVPEAERAWHAGAGRWGDVCDVNSRSIGIELANCGDHPFPEPQMSSLEVLMLGIMARWGIVPERVIGHSDMAPDRKGDPGPRFDWARLARGGLSVWPVEGVAGDFYADAARFGYPVGDVADAQVLEAFRLRFRPWASGALSHEDAALMAGLAKRWPVLRENA
ncbi:N-acetylmuramoyl-L-alanine amidase [Lentibacter sp. XHP0401]|uniref:N-acetylmuramoyl-L-alanine amidase n=1 Tax=Lentibacter sp. XHP0401 TaxID=2984334 RepID=UPI0021E871F4|nr:N-acetylmuramoyl-L-alanine amidase [Lentibacter sp. XHP0401]MCV2891550.1 N-acetylmuramoyl-L-alanine amidase [Lentibacter sp. XHP0401]